MFELLGIIFGGASRLFQHYMEMHDKQREREHEANMFDKQIALQAQRIDAERDLRQMAMDTQRDSNDATALTEAIKAQAAEAQAAGGFVNGLSASVRPVVSYWLLLIYSAAKGAALYMALQSGIPLAEAMGKIYTEFDGALLGSIVSFWFADRSLRKAGK